MDKPRYIGLTALLFVAVGLVGIFIFNQIWMRIGLGVTIGIIIAVALFFGWRSEKRDREVREGLEQV
jgi:predicted membrane channel-forming protein YqfA (hemolysin III family)